MKHTDLIFKVLICLLLCACILVTAAGCLGRPITNPEEQTASNETAEAEAEYEKKLKEILAIIDHYYVDDFDTDSLGDYLAQAAVAATGDRWSYYVSAEDYASYEEQNNNAYVGIGVTIQKMNEDDPGYTILSVTRDSPAQAAGVLQEDMILAIDGVSVADLTTNETRDLVRGEEGTSLVLTIRRDGEDMDVTVLRAVIETDVVVYELLPTGEGYIKINNFDTHCARDTLAAIEDLQSQGATALIFDLRFNPGGMKDELVRILDYLLPEGPLFRSVNYKGEESVDYSDAACLELPMAVLVNEDSYSAAEFFAAALQEYGAGVIVGTQTCGKANYQQTFRLSDGSAIAISTGHYQTPNGVTLAEVGVTPDVIVEVDEQTYADLYYDKVEHKDDSQLQAAIDAIHE